MSESERPKPPPAAATTTKLEPASAGAAPTHDLTGRALGDFRVERRLGQGGMGEVYLAHQVSLDRKVALKVLRPDLLTNPTVLSRFEAEATAVAKLNHPNIVHVYTLGDVDDLRYIAMEYVPGMNLREFLNRKGPPDLPQALAFMKQAALAIAAAGEVGLIHRDIKPENLLLNRKGQLKVADFGLCREQGDETLHLTQPGVTLGTPLYMSPEQVQGQPLDHRSDLYSLGVTFYHLLAGFPPFRAETPLALALKHVREMPISLAVHRPDLPPELVGLVMKLLAKDPTARYQTAREMIRDLDRIKQAIKATSSSALPVAPPERPPSGGRIPKADSGRSLVMAAATVGSALGQGLKGLHRPRRTVMAATAAALVVGALLGAWNRPRDLLAAGAPEPKGPPALWLDPSWAAVPRQPSARLQYRHAQLRAAEEDRRAAWLAVPGYFPADRERAFQAYTQLARSLLRRRDAAGLDGLAAALEHAAGLEHDHLTDLVRVVRAAAAALRGDPEDVVEQFKGFDPTLNVAVLNELGLEVTLQALRLGRRAGPYLTPLRTLRGALAEALSLDGTDLPESAAPG